MSVEQVIQSLRSNRDFVQQVVAWERLPARQARFADLNGVSQPIAVALQKNGITTPYLHQSIAIEKSLAGENTVIATATASGKTVCYNVPVLEKLTHNRRARALYLFPTKALAQDQFANLRGLIKEGNLRIEANVFDGDTPRGQRSKIRRNSQIILSNPDMLHAGILPFHPGWRELLSNLEYVVIDEIHTYRGIFGSHVANVMRRLKRICEFYGASPQFICCSATIANPQEHAERLCAAPFTAIGESVNGAPTGEKHFVLYNPPMIDEELGLRQSVVLTAMEAAAVFLQDDVQTVVFSRSRQSVELLLGYLRDVVMLESGGKGQIEGYRGGYLPLERRKIEEGLRNGEVRGVVATNALELGVDIGALEAAVLAGYPGSIASVWQQAGRAGRRDGVSAVVMVAGNSPLDQYICRHPRFLFGRTPENALINPDNLHITLNHLLCAAYELPFESDEAWGDWDEATELLDFLREGGDLHRTRDRYHWIGEGTPSPKISLRTGDADTVVIQTQEDEQPPRSIGEVDLFRATVTVHDEAIYMHAGQSYIVDELDWDARIAHVRPVETDYYTRASVGSEIRSFQPIQEVADGDLLRAHGEVLVVTQATNFRKVRRYTHETLGLGKIDLPAWEHETTGYRLVFGKALSERLYDAGILMRPNDYGPNWQAQRELTLEREQYRCKTCGVHNDERTLHVHHIRPFKEYGYVRGLNDNYLKANRVENLVALCPSCHRQAEQSVQARSAMGGLAYVLRNLAPLFLMCDSGDVMVSAETRSP